MFTITRGWSLNVSPLLDDSAILPISDLGIFGSSFCFFCSFASFFFSFFLLFYSSNFRVADSDSLSSFQGLGLSLCFGTIQWYLAQPKNRRPQILLGPQHNKLLYSLPYMKIKIKIKINDRNHSFDIPSLLKEKKKPTMHSTICNLRVTQDLCA